jgi:preprotein translocase subunit SecE
MRAFRTSQPGVDQTHKVKFMNKISVYVRDSYRELMEKVTWPNWTQLQQSTVIVLAATLVITLIVGVMDLVSNFVLKIIYSLFA